MKRIDASIILGLILTLLIGNMNCFAKKCETVQSEVLRLHILANSDSEKDQELKLKVRDEILKLTSDDLYEKDLETAKISANNNLNSIEEIARKVIKENGYDYNVSAEFTKMYFDTRYYEDVTMPAGSYDAVRVTIGEGKGKNWWCVLYPPLCVSPAIAEDYDEISICTETKFKPKFKIFELIESAKNYIEENFT